MKPDHPLSRWSQAHFPALPPGYNVTFSQPADVGGNYSSFVKHQEQRAARGIGGLTYEKFTGDLSGVTYSSIRAGNLEFQRQCKQFIFNVMAYQICRPVARYWLSQVELSNAMRLPGYTKDPKSYMRIKWTIDGWPWVDPLKDLKASTGLVRSGFSSRTQEVAERGMDVEALEEEIQADNERADAGGFVFDSDARKP
jgi:lambda family phage portal protein